jgi:signal transduction histidine kinase
MLVCGVCALFIAASTLARGHLRRVNVYFCCFAFNIGVWFLFPYVPQHPRLEPYAEILTRIGTFLAVPLPVSALLLFHEMAPHERPKKDVLLRSALGGALVMAPIAAMCPSEQPAGPAVVFVYVFSFLAAGLYVLDRRGRQSRSSATRAHVRTFVLIAAAAAVFNALDIIGFGPRVKVPLVLPAVAAALAIVALFAMAEAVRSERLLDLFELFGRFFVSAVIIVVIACFLTILQATLPSYAEGLLAVGVFFMVDPLRVLVETRLRKLLQRQRFDPRLRDKLAHVLDVDEMGTIVVDALSKSGRVTTAGLYLRDPDGAFFEGVATLGARAPRRVEAATARALLELLDREPVSVENLEQDVRGRRERRDAPDRDAEAAIEAARVFGDLRRGVVVGIHDEQRALIGLLAVSNDSARDPFSPDDIADLVEIAGQIRVVVENSRVYEQMKAKDRLALAGQMAVGLAHEIKNPLGSIKGAAQLLAGPGGRADQGRLLEIIIAEVDRLDGVVTSVLDLAPSRATTSPIDANAVARRTRQVLSAEPGNDRIEIRENLDSGLPRVEIDPGQLEQVLMNLLRNAAQAMHGTGIVTVSSRLRVGGTHTGSLGAGDPFVELTVADNGPGLPRQMLDKLFTPFFTTKEKGVGLGLAISRSLVQAAGGRLEVRSYEGKGTAFTVMLPARALGTPAPPPVESAAG